MTTLKAMVRKPRTDGLYSVYIRVVHNRKPGYIKTPKIVDAHHISNDGEPTDPVVNEYCAMLIRKYSDRLNRTNTSLWSVKEVIDYLLETDEEICFSDYAKLHIKQMLVENRERTAKNYKLAVAHLERYIGTTQIMFSQLTANVLKKWIESLSNTNRAKEMYPTCIRQIFKAAITDLNDDEKGIEKIKFNPWLKITIPKSDSTVQRAISAEACREFFNRPLPETKMISSLPELGRDRANSHPLGHGKAMDLVLVLQTKPLHKTGQEILLLVQQGCTCGCADGSVHRPVHAAVLRKPQSLSVRCLYGDAIPTTVSLSEMISRCWYR